MDKGVGSEVGDISIETETYWIESETSNTQQTHQQVDERSTKEKAD